MSAETEIFVSNRAWLQRTHPHLLPVVESASKQQSLLEWRATPSGRPSLVLEGRTLHSLRDPLREARRQIEALALEPGDGVVLFGAGLGYAALEALARVGPSGVVHWVEPRRDLFGAALAVTLLPDDPPLKIHDAPSPAELRDLPSKHHDRPLKIFVHEASRPLWGEAWARFSERWEDAKRRERSSERFAPLLKENLWANTDRFLSAPGVVSFFGSRRERPAVMAAAGPSLDLQLEVLQRIAPKATVVAVGSALRTLLHAGIPVDLGVITDPQEAVAEQVADLPEVVPVVFFPTASRWAWDRHSGPVLAAFAQGDGGAAWRSLRDQKGELAAFGSVSTTALDLCVRLGAPSVWIVGQDFCYAAGATHTRGAVALREGRFSSREGVERERMHAPGCIEMVNARGEKVLTHENLLSYKRAFESYIADHLSVRFVQTSSIGLALAGAEDRALEDIFDEAKDLEAKRSLESLRGDGVCDEDRERLRGGVS